MNIDEAREIADASRSAQWDGVICRYSDAQIDEAIRVLKEAERAEKEKERAEREKFRPAAAIIAAEIVSRVGGKQYALYNIACRIWDWRFYDYTADIAAKIPEKWQQEMVCEEIRRIPEAAAVIQAEDDAIARKKAADEARKKAYAEQCKREAEIAEQIAREWLDAGKEGREYKGYGYEYDIHPDLERAIREAGGRAWGSKVPEMVGATIPKFDENITDVQGGEYSKID